jgi:MFS transporter, DHA1 family, multidrug resistance protein
MIPAPRLSTLILLSGLSILPLSIFLPSLANIALEFDIDYGLASLALAGYVAVSAVLQLVLSPLSDRFGRRPIILTGIVIFTIASFGCALAPDIWTFLAFRMFQAAIASGYPVALAVIRDTTDKQRTASKIGYIAMAWSVAPMLGPLFGGLLDELFGWRASFWFLGVTGIALFALCWFDLRETNANRSNTVAEQFRRYPLLLASPLFWTFALCMALSAGTFHAFLAGSPLVAASIFDMQPTTLGFFMGTITLGFAFGSFLSGRYASGLKLTTAIMAGRIIALAGPVIGLLLFAADINHVMAFFGPCILIGIGNGITMPSANAGALSIRPEIAGTAAGLAGAVAISGSAVMSSITGVALGLGHPVQILLSILLIATLLSALAAFVAQKLEHRDPGAQERTV